MENKVSALRKGCQELEKKLSEVSRNTGMNKVVKDKRFTKSVLESKVAFGLKNLGSDRSSYKLWKEKFDNAVDQARPGSKGLLKMLGNKSISEGVSQRCGW